MNFELTLQFPTNEIRIITLRCCIYLWIILVRRSPMSLGRKIAPILLPWRPAPKFINSSPDEFDDELGFYSSTNVGVLNEKMTMNGMIDWIGFIKSPDTSFSVLPVRCKGTSPAIDYWSSPFNGSFNGWMWSFEKLNLISHFFFLN